MGIVGLVGSYETIYGGDANRINNVQLVAHLIDGKLIGPGETFSFNGTTGERTAEKGFKEAPVIINGELGTGIAGGVCQVSTTVFNAALRGRARDHRAARTTRSTSRHYPLGRDATVNYPDLDLKFVNDTSHWLLLRTFVGSDSLVVNLYGTPVNRRVVSETDPLRVSGPVPVERIDDPDMLKGHSYVEESGVPPQETSVHRKVYSASGDAPPRRHLVLRLRGREARDQGRDEGASASAEGDDDRGDRDDPDDHDSDRADADDYDDDADAAEAPGSDSTRANSALSRSGMRVGRSVCASTHACVVQPSAIGSPSRSIR